MDDEPQSGTSDLSPTSEMPLRRAKGREWTEPADPLCYLMSAFNWIDVGGLER
jgi:hypothetical protein